MTNNNHHITNGANKAYRAYGAYRAHKAYRAYKAHRLMGLLLLWGLLFSSMNLSAQITIGGNVYGGGNEGDTGGNTTVTIHTGTIKNVFGGARMADVGGRAFVNIDGEHSEGVVLISSVFGGNDISGTVGTNVNPSDTGVDQVPEALKDVIKSGNPDTGTSKKNAIDNSWAAFVRTSPMATEGEGVEDATNCILVGSVFGGGNGDYDYVSSANNPSAGKTTHYIFKRGDRTMPIAEKVTTTGEPGFTSPTLTKTYLELNGGCLSQVYGGGNNATVTENTTISMNNPSKGLQSLFPPASAYSTLDEYRAALMTQLIFLANYTGLSMFQGDYTNLDYTSARVFGGNNKAEMRIMPTWNLQRGKIRDLYSGGNEGDMTSQYGLLMDIDPLSANSEYLVINNVYGGCRRADVNPKTDGGDPPTTIQLPSTTAYQNYKFPPNFSARTIVRGGHITNVYGGNDISGRVFGGDAVGIYTTVYGDVYGGGNGSYSYTDNAMLGAMTGFQDFYYDPVEVRLKERSYNNPSFEYTSSNPVDRSVEALNIFRPNAEQVSILVRGKDAAHPTIIKGSVYLGGNSATLKKKGSSAKAGSDPIVELKIGSYVIADKVYLGNNGEQMVTEDILELYAKTVDASGNVGDSYNYDYSQMDLTVDTIFAKYMNGCAMELYPRVVFEQKANTDPYDYVDYSSQFGSFYCGGNRGSMIWPGTNTITFNKDVIIFDKFVGGCNNANIEARAGLNAAYNGGMIGSPAEQGPMGKKNADGSIQDCLILNLSGLKIMPKRWKDDNDPSKGLEWNTFDFTTGLNVTPPTEGDVNIPIDRNNDADAADFNRRLRGGNIYGGCYESGRMNGNVTINLLDDIIDLTGDYAVFDIVSKTNPILYANDTYTITHRNSGVILDEQGMDPLGMALNVFGAGYGKNSEVWGRCTVNLRNGFTFQIFGGGQEGVIGQAREDFAGTALGTIQSTDYEFNGKHYFYDPRFSAVVNMQDEHHISGSPTSNVPETVFIYGGSFKAPIAGNTQIFLGDGRLFNTFAGSCIADILGHTETYVGKAYDMDGTTLINGFPYVSDHIYGGNDVGGRILGEMGVNGTPSAEALADCDFTSRLTANGQDLTKVYKYNASSNPNPSVLTASAYIEYNQGHIVNIFGGAYGDYDYTDEKYREYCDQYGQNKPGFFKPRLGNAFINFKPSSNIGENEVAEIFGAGQGQHYVVDRDSMQERSYILIDIPQNMTQFENTAVFGAGSYGGLGMELDSTVVAANPDKASAVIDLFRGQIKNVYGGSYNEGVTRRTVVNVPVGSTLTANNIFGGAYGVDNRYPCDVYESNVNYNASTQISGGIYGGNNNARRTIYANVNVNATVWSNKASGYQGYAYGAGKGANTWAEYTNVNIGDGGVVYKVFGGGDAGQVLNKLSVLKKKQLADADTNPDTKGLDIKIGGGYTNCGLQAAHLPYTELALDIEVGKTKDFYHKKEKYNTNVHILRGGLVTGYAYGAGYGETATVSGSTYIDILGGTVDKDIYAGGQGGDVRDLYSLKTFTATANAYVKSGMVRNAYGGGYLGPIGYHDGAITAATTNDVLARSNVVVGVLPEKLEANPKTSGEEGYDPDYHFYHGVPAITRNVYGSGEGGSIYGSAHLTINNGYVGYRYTPTATDKVATTDFDERYVEELDDPGQGENASANAIEQAGNAFGGGYIANSYVDTTYVSMYGGHLRGSMFGGGEVGPVGRGTKKNWGTGAEIDNPNIIMGGSTHVYLYKGQVHRSVFGGGRGYDSWGGDGTKFMTAAQISASDFYTKGFVFGNTDVNIRGGIVGTPEGVGSGLDGDGNVFGGGDVGYVYCATGSKVGSNPNALSPSNGLPTDGGGYYYKGGVIANGMTVDCSVDVAPYCQVKAGQTLTLPKLQTDTNGNFVRETSDENPNQGYPVKVDGQTVTFNEYDYVPVEYLNLLNKGTGTYGEGAWNKVDYESGITIHNAVFAGGNVSVGSDQVFVNSNTVFGNATAALRDAYHRDLITIGTEHIGGLYGDGNLTFVDGFRELNISNYGTDFYGLSDKITVDEYHNKSDRERAYFQLEYECQQTFTYNEKTYTKDSRLKESEYEEIFKNTTYYNNEAYWKEAGFCSLYAGRLLNTVQRADFVGVWGSRMVLQGARDRVPEKADYTNYTINRVGEVSLNCAKTQCSEDTGAEDVLHGNYFGIYSIVNYLGNLTSDVSFDAVRVTDTNDENGKGNKATVTINSVDKPYGTATYWDWKKAQIKERNRNNGTSKNMVALASGVYLEIINESTEKRTDGGTDWGYITGVIQLDLINVMQGLGGGYVYAKNEHGAATHHTDWDKVTMSPYNLFARTYKRYTYATVTATDEVETSGNFIHNTKQIVDDCYPMANSFYGAGKVAAHYWYIKGSIYVYDQYISAFTGSATAYSKNISLPLTISANAHGKLQMVEVQPSLYAYYASYTNSTTNTRLGLGENDNFVANNVTYRLNDPITYWDYVQLSDEDKNKFVAETYTVLDSCYIDDVLYPKGYTMLKDEYLALAVDDSNNPRTHVVRIKDINTGNYIVDPDGIKDFKYMVRLSNNLSHNTGYALTYKVDNPMVWNDYFTKNDLSGKMNTKAYEDANKPTGYTVGATYRLKDATAGVFGQKDYKVGDIINQSVKTTYDAIPDEDLPTGQATFERAYVVKQELIVNDNHGNEHHIYPGVAIAYSEFSNNWSSISSKVDEALVITSTLELTASEYLYAGDLYSVDQLKAYIKQAKNLSDAEVDTYYAANNSYYANAYYCSAAGKYGGNLFSPNVAYTAVEAWSALSQADQAHFTFNYDALDLLIDSVFANIMTRYDGTNDPKIYSPVTPVDYEAKLTGATSVTYTPASGPAVTINNGDVLSREEFEAIPNERYHYSPITVTKADSTYYVVKSAFIRGEMPYSVGQGISAQLYGSLSADQKLKVDALDFNTLAPSASKENPVTFYYCRDPYQVNEHGEGVSVTDVFHTGQTYTSLTTGGVPVGTVITEANYKLLPNKTVDDDLEKQLFTIYGRTPMETSTLYVSRESDILDLSKEKTITVMFQYEYEESDEAGVHITPITERHIVNIHLQFKSGVPEIGQLSKPNTVLPGTTVGLKVPNIEPGAFEVLGSGWELFTNPSDAISHKNGQPYVNNDTKMYWYQDGYWVAYYAKTYLGKTYSNSVQFSVANYHDLDLVMQDKKNHMFLDHKDAHRQRDPKIYIDNRDCTSDDTKNELDLLKDFFDLSLQARQYNQQGESIPVANSGALNGHHGVNTDWIGASKNLQFYLRSDMAPKAYSVSGGSATGWTPIGTYDGSTPANSHCFEGTLHGDGYTISGLDHSLFENLCGEVYNLGVTGTFTGAGIVDNGTGYVENCWVMSDAATVNSSVKAVFGNPTDTKGTQLVNCYYPATNAYSETSHARGNARKMPASAFYNGEVTYDLNGFYLNKRYFDKALEETGNKPYGFWRANADGTLPTTGPETKYYTSDYAIYPLVTDRAGDQTYGYVEDRYADGDYIYAGGSIPENKDVRFNTTDSKYYPIWPDDYLFFGQRLTYGYVDGRPHQDTPAHINKTDTRLTAVSQDINRVYRAPAYFQSKVMGAAHYNPYAVFAPYKSGDPTTLAYQNMTAIDFTAANGDITDYPTTIAKADYKQGLQSGGLFFPPMLDNDGLEVLRNAGLTRNWLVYTPDAIDGDASAADSKTNDVVLDYLKDPVYTEANATYRTVAAQSVEQIHGHAVVKKGTNTYTAPGNHFLVDKQDFNAPVSYSFAAGQRIWYQRTPDTYVDRVKGWEGISIPFSAEVVTTNQKGEITHFYNGSEESKNKTNSKIGHEYWLREFTTGGDVSPTDSKVFVANFTYPTEQPAWYAGTDDEDKEYTNTFLWDYYYRNSGSPRLDQNTDTYQQQYYKDPKDYEDYAYSAAAKPYIIGFPGTTYYEFDLSGDFQVFGAQNANEIVKLSKQTITFASPVSTALNPVTIAVSDDEMTTAAVTPTSSSYTFRPNYLGKEVAAGAFMMAADGSSYDVTAAATAGVPFRPYFTTAPSPVKGQVAESIIFSNINSQLGNDEEQPDIQDRLDGELIVKGKRGRILVTSKMTEETTVHIINAAGALIRTFTITPGETIETNVVGGVYIVNKTKISIK